MVAHACHFSYSEDKDQEDDGLRSAWSKTLRDLLHPTEVGHGDTSVTSQL
jgi:hypothetical protein